MIIYLILFKVIEFGKTKQLMFQSLKIIYRTFLKGVPPPPSPGIIHPSKTLHSCTFYSERITLYTFYRKHIFNSRVWIMWVSVYLSQLLYMKVLKQGLQFIIIKLHRFTSNNICISFKVISNNRILKLEYMINGSNICNFLNEQKSPEWISLQKHTSREVFYLFTSI